MKHRSVFITLLACCYAHTPRSPLFSSAGWQFLDACERGDSVEVTRLIPTVEDHMEGLMKACEFGHFKVVEQLLWFIKICCESVAEPVHVAAANGHVEIVKHLVDYSFPIKEDSPRMIYAMAKNEKIFRIVFQEGRPISVRDTSRLLQTILFYALRSESLDVIRLALTWKRLKSIFPLSDRLQAIESSLTILAETQKFNCAGVLAGLAILYRKNKIPVEHVRIRGLQEMYKMFLLMKLLEGEYALPGELIAHILQFILSIFHKL